MSLFIRHCNEYPLRALQNFGEQLSKAQGLAAVNQQFAHAAALNNISLDRYLWRKVSAGRWLLHSGCWNVVRIERPQHQEGAAMNYYAGLDDLSEDGRAWCAVQHTDLTVP
jgi:hypothetical protein